MPSRAPKGKSPRRRVHWPRMLALLVVVNVALGLTLSPVTAIRTARVIGAPADDEARLRQLFADVRQTPALRLNRTAFESRVLERDDLRSVRLTHNLFGSAVLRVEPRRAVARLAGHAGSWLDAEGEVYRGVGRPALPEVTLASLSPVATPALVGSGPTRAAADLCRLIPKTLDPSSSRVQVDRAGVLSLSTGKGLRIVFGSSERLPEKLNVLGRALAQRPSLVREAETINLTAPDQPVFVPRRQRQ